MSLNIDRLYAASLSGALQKKQVSEFETQVNYLIWATPQSN